MSFAAIFVIENITNSKRGLQIRTLF